MPDSVDFSALALALVVSATITAVVMLTNRGGTRRGWIAAGLLALALIAVGAADIVGRTPRDVHVATVFIGAALPVLGATGMVHGTHRVRPLYRWPLVFATTLVLLLGGLLIGAAIAPRFF